MHARLPLLIVLPCFLLAGILFVGARKAIPAHQGKSLQVYIEELTSGDYQVRNRAAEAIRAIGLEATPYLVRALRTQDSPFEQLVPFLGRRLPFLHLKTPPRPALLRERAAEQLGLNGSTNMLAIKALVSALSEKNSDVLSEIQHALRRIGPASIPQLIEALRSSDPQVRRSVCQVLIDFGPEARAAVPALVKALKDSDEMVRCRAASALGLCLTQNVNAIEPLIGMLADKTPQGRRSAAEALGRLGVNARAAIPGLSKCLSDTNAGVRVSAARSLWQIDGEVDKVLPVLIEALSDSNVGWQAPFILGEIGPRAAPAVPALIETMKRERVSRPLRSAPSSAFALGQIGAAAVPALAESLNDADPWVRTAAAISLGFIGPPARLATPSLVSLLKDKHLEIQQASALSLISIAPETPELGPALQELVHDEDIFISGAALEGLRKRGEGMTASWRDADVE